MNHLVGMGFFLLLGQPDVKQIFDAYLDVELKLEDLKAASGESVQEGLRIPLQTLVGKRRD
ncbi:hypothetical protein ACE6ED_29035 [Paenibacillus sp. CN-4]|uniref:hypothetical protein n=1 Tax=Paenibacillus nanchangensis TaxID=3348343 RepID=UPI00397D9465